MHMDGTHFAVTAPILRIPPSSTAATRVSTFSLRDAASSTSTISGFFCEGPSTSKSRLTSSSGFVGAA